MAGHIRCFILASLTIAGPFGAAIGDILTSIVAWVLHSSAFVWKPDARASLALDRLTHGADTAHDVSILQRFKAFMERARTHLLFDGAEFLHGRPNHLMC